MRSIALRWLRPVLVMAAFALVTAALLAGCTEQSPVGPVDGAATAAIAGTDTPALDLGVCDTLAVPAGSVLAAHVYAQGTQVYRWDGTTWNLLGPSATLFADAAGKGIVGTHYTGPTWESTSGSSVVGAVSRRCTPDPDAIPWLLLAAVRSKGPGVFQGVTHIQRVHTVGGKAPTETGSVTDQVRGVPYTAEYFFYRAP